MRVVVEMAVSTPWALHQSRNCRATAASSSLSARDFGPIGVTTSPRRLIVDICRTPRRVAYQGVSATFVNPATVTLAFRLAATVGAGLVAILAFVVLTVDRLNARVAELEAQLAARGPRPDPAPRPSSGRAAGERVHRPAKRSLNRRSFHAPRCRNAAISPANQVAFGSAADAEAAGYRPGRD
jgi:hypothetical protein